MSQKKNVTFTSEKVSAMLSTSTQVLAHSSVSRKLLQSSIADLIWRWHAPASISIDSSKFSTSLPGITNNLRISQFYQEIGTNKKNS